MHSLAAALVAFSLAGSPAQLVQAEPDGGLVMPDALRGLLQSLPPELAQTLLRSTVETLVVAIRQAHDEAAQTARPMPARLQRVLRPIFRPSFSPRSASPPTGVRRPACSRC
jgi:hypothetical protein